MLWRKAAFTMLPFSRRASTNPENRGNEVKSYRE